MTREEHTKEITQSRIVGLGGSDAKMMRKVGVFGIESLTQEEINILDSIVDNNYPSVCDKKTVSDSDLCDIFAEEEPLFERDSIIKMCSHSKSFDVFAIADFVEYHKVITISDMHDVLQVVYVCRVSNEPISTLKESMHEELQLYYALGVDLVVLVHGDVVDGKVYYSDQCEIRRDQTCITELYLGMNRIDDYVVQKRKEKYNA